MRFLKFCFLCFFFPAINGYAQNLNSASNGLTKEGSNVKLGGTTSLSENTSIDLGATYYFNLKKSTSNYFTVLNGGNVGIGTLSPAYKLDVNGTLRATGNLTFSSGAGPGRLLMSTNASGDASWLVLGTALQQLRVKADLSGLEYFTPSGGGSTTLNSTQIAFGDGSNQLSSSSEFTWNGTNLMLGNLTPAGITNPVSINIGATFGSNTPGTPGNLKLKLWDDNVGNVYGLGISAYVMEYQSPTGSDHRFYAGGTEIMRLSSTGNVGIGTTNPSRRLDIIGSPIFQSNDINSSVRMKPSSTSYNGGNQVTDFYDHYDVGNSAVGLFGIANTTWAAPLPSFAFVSTKNGSGSVKDMMFWANDNPSSSNVALTIKANTSNVGINNSIPGYKLHVTEPAVNTPAAVFEGGGGASILQVRPISGQGRVDIGFTGTGEDMYLVGTNVTSGFRIVGASSPLYLETILDQPIRIKTNSIERMIIDGSGNVGIGTSNTQGYRFAVNGDAIFTKVKVKQYSTWPDYVFHSPYNLMPLIELEKYIQKNKHLPDVPSAKEVEDNGLDLGDTQATMLKKIEELTLYIIEINKKVEKLSEENAELKKKLVPKNN